MEDEYRAQSRRYLEDLAAGRHNDAVKLLLMSGELDAGSIDELELDQISELKRDGKGGIEIKFIDKLAVIRELNMLEQSDAREDADGNFYAALDKAARELGLTTRDEV